MDFAELAELIQTRRSVRQWQDRDVPDELIARALELAVWAPNGGNRQPWRFLVIKNRALIGRMADAVRAATDLMASWPEARELGPAVQRWRVTSDFFRQAPVCIAALVGNYESIADRLLALRGTGDPAARDMQEARRLGSSRLQSASAAIMQLLLALHLQGLGTCWMTGPQQATAEIERLLAVPPDVHFIALIPVGYPAGTPKPGWRRPLEEVVQFYR